MKRLSKIIRSILIALAVFCLALAVIAASPAWHLWRAGCNDCYSKAPPKSGMINDASRLDETTVQVLAIPKDPAAAEQQLRELLEIFQNEFYLKYRKKS